MQAGRACPALETWACRWPLDTRTTTAVAPAHNSHSHPTAARLPLRPPPRAVQVAYCQGMNFIAALLLMFMPTEAHAFAGLVVLMEDRGLRRFYHRSMSLLQVTRGVRARMRVCKRCPARADGLRSRQRGMRPNGMPLPAQMGAQAQ